MSDFPITLRFISNGITPTDEQKTIQVAGDRIILMEAIAGGAKTTTLALRIGESLERGVPADKILVLVFTTAAKHV